MQPITKIVGVFRITKTIIDMVKISQNGLNAVFMANPYLLDSHGDWSPCCCFYSLVAALRKIQRNMQKSMGRNEKVGGYIWNYLVGYFKVLKTVIEAVLKPIKAVVNGLKKIFGYNGKTANVTVHESSSGSEHGGSSGKVSSGKHNALGTSYFSGGTTTINEFGKEQINLPSGTEIIPADKVGKNSGTNIIVNCTIQGNVIGNQEYMEQTGNYIAARIKSALANS